MPTRRTRLRTSVAARAHDASATEKQLGTQNRFLLPAPAKQTQSDEAGGEEWESGWQRGPVAVVLGSMGAGGVGGSLSYQERVNFSVNVATDPFFTVDLLDNKSLGKGFDSATFQISENGTVLENHLFTDLASAQAFFSDNPINLTLLAGLNIVQLSFNEKISGGDGFAFDYATTSSVVTPLPTTLPLFATGLAGLGLLGWRRKKKAAA